MSETSTMANANTTATALNAKKGKAAPAPAKAKAPAPDRRLTLAADRFKLLGDPCRLRLLAELLRAEQNVGELVDRMGVTQPAVSHHLALLRASGVVAGRREGKCRVYAIDEDVRPLVAAALAAANLA